LPFVYRNNNYTFFNFVFQPFFYLNEK